MDSTQFSTLITAFIAAYMILMFAIGYRVGSAWQ